MKIGEGELRRWCPPPFAENV